MADSRLEAVQSELKTIHEEILQRIKRVAELGRELIADEPENAMTPERFMGDNLVEADSVSDSLTDYLNGLDRWAEMSTDEIRREAGRQHWRYLVDVSTRASRNLTEVGEMLQRACGDENVVGLASLLRGVHRTAESYAVLADRLEAHTRAELGLSNVAPSAN